MCIRTQHFFIPNLILALGFGLRWKMPPKKTAAIRTEIAAVEMAAAMLNVAVTARAPVRAHNFRTQTKIVPHVVSKVAMQIVTKR